MAQTMMLIEKSSHCASWYNAESGELLGRTALPEYPHEFVIDAANKYAYVGHYGVQNSGVDGNEGRSVVVIDLDTKSVAHSYDLGEHARPHGIELDAQGRLYVLSEWSATLLVKDNPSDFGAAYDRSAPTGGVKSHLCAVQADGRRAYSMNLVSGDVTVFDPQDQSVTPVSIKSGTKPEGRCLRGDEKVLFTTNRGDNQVAVIDTGSLEVIQRFDTPEDPVRIFHDTRRERLVTINHAGKSISFFDAKDGREVHRHETPASPVALCFDDDQSCAYISVDCEQVQKISLDSFETLFTFETMKEPDVMRILPDGFSDRWTA